MTRVVFEFAVCTWSDENVGDIGAISVAVGKFVKVFNDWRLHIKATWTRVRIKVVILKHIYKVLPFISWHSSCTLRRPLVRPLRGSVIRRLAANWRSAMYNGILEAVSKKTKKLVQP
jgi:hypothetical protein